MATTTPDPTTTAIASTPVVRRVCGECVVCCVYPRIQDADLQKPAMVHCPHVQTDEPEDPGRRVCYTGTGCVSYASRPQTCVRYLCEWILGHGAQEDRPDRCGVLIDRSRGIENAIECKPLWPEAAEEPAGQAAIRRISQSTGMCALVLSFYERQLVRVVGRP